MLRVSRDVLGPGSWVAQFLSTAVAESNGQRAGGEAVLELMSKMMFVEALRRYAERPGVLLGPEAPSLAQGLASSPAGKPWRLGELRPEPKTLDTTPVPGVDVSKLAEKQQKLFFRLVEKAASARLTARNSC